MFNSLKKFKAHMQGCASSYDSRKGMLQPATLNAPPVIFPKPEVVASDDSFLYVIIPYFNYCKYASRKQLLIEFVNRIKSEKGIRIVLVECRLEERDYDLPMFSDIYMHVRCTSKHQLWIKENLINIGIHHLPNTWKYVSWIDADLTFVNDNWVQDTINELNKYDVVQMFQRALFMGPDYEVLKEDRGFGYMFKESGNEYTKTYKYGFWHPGFAWACTRGAYRKMKRLIDFGILGSGDHHMALALIGKVESSHPGGIHANYIQKLKEFQDRCSGLRLGYVKGVILHHYHGSIADRRYQERWNVLVKNEYDPETDITVNTVGLVQFTRKGGEKLEKHIAAYFLGRNEDKK
jgi:hypothetical protein